MGSIIDLRDDPDRLAKSLTQLGLMFKQLFRTDQEKAFDFYTQNPALAEEMVRGERRRLKQINAQKEQKQLEIAGGVTPQVGPAGKPIPEPVENPLIGGGFDEETLKAMGGRGMLTALMNLVGITDEEAQEERLIAKEEFERAQKTGPQELAALKLARGARGVVPGTAAAPTEVPGEVGVAGAPPTGAAPRKLSAAELYAEAQRTPSISQDELRALAPILVDEQMKEERVNAYRQQLNASRKSLTPDQIINFEAYIKAIEAGAPEEAVKELFPKAIVDLESATLEVKDEKDMRVADKVATNWLVQNGYLPPGAARGAIGPPGTALKMMYEERARIQEDAREAKKKAMSSEVMEATIKGAALLAQGTGAAAGVDGVTNYIMQQNPQMAALGKAFVFKHVNDALVPTTESQARIRSTAPAAFKAINTIQKLEDKASQLGKKGPGLGTLAFLASVDPRGAAGLGALGGLAFAGARTGGTVAGGTGALIGAAGAVAGGAGLGYFGSPILRNIGRRMMNTEDQLMFNSAQNLAAAIYRRESGAAVQPWEVRTTIERYIPLETDGAEVRELKRQLREGLAAEIETSSGLPNLSDNAARQAFESTAGQRADVAIARARAKDETSATTRAVNQLLSESGNDPKKAAGTLRKVQFEVGPGERPRKPNAQFNETIRVLGTITLIDEQVSELRKIPGSEALVQELLVQRAKLTGQ